MPDAVDLFAYVGKNNRAALCGQSIDLRLRPERTIFIASVCILCASLPHQARCAQSVNSA